MLKGILKTLKNSKIILYAILLAEAKESTEIDNIITTFDELYKENTLIQVLVRLKKFYIIEVLYV